MHEVGIAVEIAEMAAAAAGEQKVAGVFVRIGALAGVVKEALLFAWPSVSEARLEIEDSDGRELELTAVEVEDGSDR